MPLEAGSAIFLDSKIVPGTGPNKTPHPRNTALYAYFPPNVRYIPPPPRGGTLGYMPGSFGLRGAGGS